MDPMNKRPKLCFRAPHICFWLNLLLLLLKGIQRIFLDLCEIKTSFWRSESFVVLHHRGKSICTGSIWKSNKNKCLVRHRNEVCSVFCGAQLVFQVNLLFSYIHIWEDNMKHQLLHKVITRKKTIHLEQTIAQHHNARQFPCIKFRKLSISY